MQSGLAVGRSYGRSRYIILIGTFDLWRLLFNSQAPLDILLSFRRWRGLSQEFDR